MAQRIQRGRDDIRVMVRYPRDERRSLGDPGEHAHPHPRRRPGAAPEGLRPRPGARRRLHPVRPVVQCLGTPIWRAPGPAGRRRPCRLPDDDEDNGDEGEGRRAATCASRRGAVAAPRDLGEPALDGRPPPPIDCLHKSDAALEARRAEPRGRLPRCPRPVAARGLRPRRAGRHRSRRTRHGGTHDAGVDTVHTDPRPDPRRRRRAATLRLDSDSAP